MNSLSLRKLGFKQQLVAVFAIGILCLSAMTSLVISSLSSRTLHGQLMEQGRQLTLSFANRSKVALLYESADSAQQAVQATMAFPDVTSVAIYTRNHAVLAHEGNLDRAAAPQWPNAAMDVVETEEAWHFAAPVMVATTAPDTAAAPYAQPEAEERVGYVRLTLTKDTLARLTAQIVRHNLLISLGFAALLLTLLLWVTHRLTDPLKRLADIMRRSQAGESNLRAELGGPRDIQEMENAFNTMMNELEAREQSLKRARDSALGMAHAKSEFTAMVSHELRTPMNGVLSMLELVRTTGLTDKQDEYVQIARDSGKALLLLIDDILDFAKIEAGKMRVFPTNFLVRKLADDIVELLRLQASAKKLELRTEIALDVPMEACADTGRVRQILINLLGNAIKFTEQGTVTLRITCNRMPELTQLVFEVSDTGIGIPENALDRIFEAFSQVDSSTTRRYSGTGLGLTICRQLARLMGGEITVASELGRGSCFTLTLPVTLADAGGEIASDTLDQLAGLRILSVGADVEYGRRLCNYVIVDGGFARHVSDTAQARDMLRNASLQNKPYDLILIDRITDMTAQDFAVAISHELDISPAKVVLFDDAAAQISLSQPQSPVLVVRRPLDRIDLLNAVVGALNNTMHNVMPNPVGIGIERAPQLTADLRPEQAPENAPPRVLIADDNRANQQVAQSMVEQMGYSAIVVDNGEQALAVVQQQDIALVLMDCYMPVLDGFAATEAIRNLNGPQRQLPILGMTARLGVEEQPQCLAAGMDEVLLKPLSLDVLRHSFSRFLMLPEQSRRVAASTARSPRVPLDPNSTPPRSTDRPYVLVVDDERSARLSIIGILEEDGYDLVEATNGQEALELCQLQMPDLILMDGMMPEMDGFTACRRILDLPAKVYPTILIITALHDEESVAKAFAAGAIDYIAKPTNLLVLRKRVERILREHRSASQIQQLAYYDQLTHLPNRSLFLQRGADIVNGARQRGERLAVLFMDLDRFKLINDTLGHDVGDKLLLEAAERLQGCIRASDLIARLGGDEFVIVLENIQAPDTVAAVANKICRSFGQPFAFGQRANYVHTSIGIALFPDDGDDISTLMKRADTAMFRSKAKGGGSYQYYEFGMESEILRKVELENELRHALNDNQLELHYQPQINLHDNQIRGFEALIRWRHPVRGLISPGEFIPLAEECGLIGKLGEWVLARVCEQLREWRNTGLPVFPVSVNVAYSQLISGDLPNFIQSTLADAGLPADLLRLEFTETSLIDTQENAIAQMNRLTILGVSLEIDDFGTGYSSLSYLKYLPVDIMKIDRSFINDMLVDEASAAIVAGIISMAHKIGLLVVAEGVETQEQLGLLRTQGCDIVQGYYISRALPVKELQQWMQNFSPLKPQSVEPVGSVP